MARAGAEEPLSFGICTDLSSQAGWCRCRLLLHGTCALPSVCFSLEGITLSDGERVNPSQLRFPLLSLPSHRATDCPPPSLSLSFCALSLAFVGVCSCLPLSLCVSLCARGCMHACMRARLCLFVCEFVCLHARACSCVPPLLPMLSAVPPVLATMQPGYTPRACLFDTLC